MCPSIFLCRGPSCRQLTQAIDIQKPGDSFLHCAKTMIPAPESNFEWSLQIILSCLFKGDWVCFLDFQDTYLYIRVAKRSRRFLCFWVGASHSEFGLAKDPSVFAKCMTMVVAHLRSHGQKFSTVSVSDCWLHHCWVIWCKYQTLCCSCYSSQTLQ